MQKIFLEGISELRIMVWPTNSFNVLYVVICSGCLEQNIGKMGAGKTLLRYRVRLERQHVKQPEQKQLKLEEYIQICGGGSFNPLCTDGAFKYHQIWTVTDLLII